MITRYQPPAENLSEKELAEDISSVFMALLEAENVSKDGVTYGEKTLHILSELVDRKRTKVKTLELLAQKIEFLNSLHNESLNSLEEQHSDIRKRIVIAKKILEDLKKIAAEKGCI
ncbi:MAG TPA: hypothetical protein VN368_02850 [Candidatus Methylomirabilis sp.]|nr:hypothetical protein [Candidatus Methylomirabilis sp.]